MPDREPRTSSWMRLAQDVRQAIGTLYRAPVFTVVALLTLTIGVGANTAIFSLVNVLVLRDLPVRNPSSLVQFLWQYPGDQPRGAFFSEEYERFRDGNTVFEDVFGTYPVSIAADVGGVTETVNAELITANFFAALGVRPAVGRLVGAQDAEAGALGTAVISWSYWRKRFNEDPGVLGARVVVLGVVTTVIGVAERDFTGLVVGQKPDIWIASSAFGSKQPGFIVLARLKDSVAIDRARAEMLVLDRPRIEERARTDPQWLNVKLQVEPARAGIWTPLHGLFTKPLLVLLAIVGVLLLLACANIGSMLLARGAARQHEMAVRISLGADRFQLARQVSSESVVLAGAGSLLGLATAYVGTPLLVRSVMSGRLPLGTPSTLDVPVDPNVLGFAAGVTILAVMFFGIAPAWAAFRLAPAPMLQRRGVAGQTASRRLFGNGLVIAQVALSLILLSVSQLYLGHLSSLRNQSLGFDRHSVLLVSVDKARARQNLDRLTVLYPDVLEQFGRLPGVRTATVSAMIPLSGAAGSRFVTVEGFREDPQARRRLLLNGVAPNFFATFGTPLIAGRDFRAADAEPARVAIVNEAMARYYFAGASPLGKFVWFDQDPQPYAIIGLVGNAKYADVRAAAPPTIYLHYSTLRQIPTEFSLRTSTAPLALADDVRRILEAPPTNLPVTRITTLAEHVDATLVPERLITALSGLFGVVGILLTATGLYGLLAYAVARRTREIGVRMAVGATARSVMALVLTQALGLVSVGLVIGLPIAFWTKQIAGAMVENLSGDSLFPIVTAVIGTIAVSLLAAWVPARRATRVDPLAALRSE
ncbi:MAG: ABC transporter permease [Acidobacteriota bacterium]